MAIPLNILIVEDSPDDAKFLVQELRDAGFDPKWKRVQNEPDFRAGLKEVPDLIFSDFSLPQFSVRRALELLREARLTVPFIIVSGTIGEERAVESLKAGATDYVLKDAPARLGIAVERALREAKERSERQRVEQRLDSFFSGATAGLAILDRDLRFIQINQTLAQMNGLSVEDHLGRTPEEVLPEFARQATPLMESVLRTAQPVLDTEITAPTAGKGGMIRHWRASYFPIYGHAGQIDGVGCVVVEITARKQAEQALRTSEERFRQLAENIDEVFWITDPTRDQMLYVSPAYETIWGRTCESLIRSPRSWFDAIHAEDRARVMEAAMSEQSQSTYDEVYRIIRPGGSLRWIHDRAFPVRDASGQVLRMVGIAEDITKQRELEEQFRHVQKMESIGQLAGGVAHDFNNLLTVIQGHASLLLMDSAREEREESAEQISLAAERAASLTRQLLTFSRRQVMQIRELNVDDVIDSVIKMLTRVLGADITLQFTRSDLPPILADAGMLEQILMNLAVNARDAMPKGGTLTIRTGTEMIDELFVKQNPEAHGGKFVWLSVTDTGSGIPARALPKIFEPFFTTKEVGKGTGLGLATVYGIVKQHRGWITVQSQVGKGTTFKIYFPAIAADAGTSSAPKEEIKVRGGQETILLVEDDRAVRELVRHVLESHGYRLIEADCGKAALEEWQRQSNKIDLLLTDLVMPGGMTGRELADVLRAQQPRLRVVFMSGYSSEVVGKDFQLREGINFLQKPCAPRILAKCVRDCLDSSQV